MSTVGDLNDAIEGRLILSETLGSVNSLPLGPVVTDSRKVQPGDVFWGLRGANYDGARFVSEAFHRGASGAVVAKSVVVPEHHWAIRVADAQKALWAWAAQRRSEFHGSVVGVTGSVGKTTTREMIHTILQSRLQGVASPQNYNNHVGVPLSLMAMEPHHDYAVIELGANHLGEIAALADLARPTIGVITGIGDAHLGIFGGRERIAQAKAELLAALPSDGWAVLADDPWLHKIAEGCRCKIIWVGMSKDCDFQAENIHYEPGQLTLSVQDCQFVAPVWGRHHAMAILSSVAVGDIFGFDLDEIARALYKFRPMPMRCQVHEIRGTTVINDTYNSNPTAMKAALELLRDMNATGRRIVVCGDMGELGDASIELHVEAGKQMVDVARADMVIACGQFAQNVVEGARKAGMSRMRAIPCNTVEDVVPYLRHAMLPGDAVLMKGSRMMGMERILTAIEQYPNRKVA
jgi:UDP-N-acetylmuramoyl-tripeptide--D-alanyl-D-alanine ligase